MMMRVCWARLIRGRWYRLAPLLLAVCLVVGLTQGPRELAPLAREYRDSPTSARRDALLRYAAAHPNDSDGALALLTVGATEVEGQEYDQALRHLGAAAPRLPQLGDYVAFALAKVHFGRKEFDQALGRLEAILEAAPVSPLAGQAALLAAGAHLEAGSPEKAVAVLRQYLVRLPQPEGDLTMATAYELAGPLPLAAAFGQQVYYGYPASRQAADAGQLLSRVQGRLGSDYPPPLPGAMLGRAAKWLDARDYRRAQTEYAALIPQLGGAERELAQVRAGAALYLAGNARQADAYLRTLVVKAPDTDAERLYHLVRCERTLEDSEGMLDFLGRLKLQYPDSQWRLSALTWAGNYYLLQNDRASYLPLYRACYEAFPGDPSAAYCHWKVAWTAYLERRAEAGQLLGDHLKLFPQSDKCPATLYFLGRLAEASSDRASARASYRKILETYPNHYYAALAAERLKPETMPAAASVSADFAPAAAASRHISRSRLLASAGLSDWAKQELVFSAKEDGQPHAIAVELARQASSRGAAEEAIRYIKAFVPNYLGTPLDAAPLEMWRLAFPLPFRQQIETHGKAQGLDPYLLAGLIRQESEFDADVISKAGAYGLMQVMPATGRELSRTLKLGRFRTGLLTDPGYNIRMGTFYFRSLLDAAAGSTEAALASYNGGKTRVDDWLTWGPFSEPAEFVETIPISETRTYVQAVLRNQWMYRRIYTGKAVGIGTASVTSK
jgi:soluble lytic murein transglycosylase